jgi:hypothetical protein
VLTSTRMRRKLEKQNTLITIELGLMLGAKKKKPTSSSGHSNRDIDGRGLWEDQFGLENPSVEWSVFISGFKDCLGIAISTDDEEMLRGIIDHSNTGYISLFRLTEFLKGFGPPRACIPMMKRILGENWFYHFLSQKEAKHLLYGEKVGTYLVRFSKSRPGSFALEFVYKTRVQSVIVESCMPEGLKIREQGELERVFQDIYGILSKYQKLLVHPLQTGLPIGKNAKSGWFHGDLTREEANEMLKNQKQGTFLLRFGDKPEEYFANFALENDAIGEIRIEYFPNEVEKKYLAYEPNGRQGYRSLHALVQAHRDIFKYNYDADGVPSFRIKRIRELAGPLESIHGPENIMQGNHARLNLVAGSAVSAYPPSPGGWWPICDCFSIDMYETTTLLVLCDGCNWGPRPQNAAHAARAAIGEYMRNHIASIEDAKQAGHELQQSFAYAHQKIIEPYESYYDAGTTAVIAGMLLHLDEDASVGKYGFVCASVGDCKAYLWSKRTGQVQDITRCNRSGVDATDPGGRIGPYLDGGAPDYRNLAMFFILCEEGDMIFATSDGVFDNFDPEYLGKRPNEIGFDGSFVFRFSFFVFRFSFFVFRFSFFVFRFVRSLVQMCQILNGALCRRSLQRT